jgi:hypothetical protein
MPTCPFRFSTFTVVLGHDLQCRRRDTQPTHPPNSQLPTVPQCAGRPPTPTTLHAGLTLTPLARVRRLPPPPAAVHGLTNGAAVRWAAADANHSARRSDAHAPRARPPPAATTRRRPRPDRPQARPGLHTDRHSHTGISRTTEPSTPRLS